MYKPSTLVVTYFPTYLLYMRPFSCGLCHDIPFILVKSLQIMKKKKKKIEIQFLSHILVWFTQGI
jgi:hypothetical protein